MKFSLLSVWINLRKKRGKFGDKYFLRWKKSVRFHIKKVKELHEITPVFRTPQNIFCKSLILLIDYFEYGCCKCIFEHVFT